jgi:hypothetical protein
MNILILDRVRYDTLTDNEIPFNYNRLVQNLDFFIIEETNGSVTFIKNKLEDKKIYFCHEYDIFKSKHIFKRK